MCAMCHYAAMPYRAGAKRTLPRVVGAVVASAVVVFGLGVTSTHAPAHAQTPSFVALDDLVTEAASSPPDRVLFFPLDQSFNSCIPLQAACPADSSTVMLVPATGRALTWRPEGGDLHLVELDTPPMPAIGVAPERYESVRYLLPVLDGTGIQLFHMPRSYADGRLVGDDAAALGSDAGTETGASRAEAVTPVLGGSLLSTSQPAPPPERILDPPLLIDRSDLADATPALFVRRSAPSRIVFGVRPDPGWELDTSYVPMLDDGVVAFAGRHVGRVGLAVPAPPDLDADTLDRLSRSESAAGTESEEGLPWSWMIGGAIAIAAGAAALATHARHRRRRS